MNGQDEMNQDEIKQEDDPVVPGQPETAKKSKLPWIIGGSVLLLVIALCAGVVAYFGLSFFSDNDPIAAVVPNDVLVYVSMDFLQAQSEDFNKALEVFKEISEVDEPQTSDEAADEFFSEEYGLSFTEDVLPWMGRHGSFVVNSADINSEEIEFMFLVESRNKSAADDFLTKFVAAIEEDQGISFETVERDGVTLQVYRSDFGSMEDIVIARDGKFVYMANSEDIVVESVGLKKADSLARDAYYTSALSGLSGDRLATMYMSVDSYIGLLDDMTESDLFYGSPTSFPDVSEYGFGGIAVGASFIEEGLRFDFAVAYDEANLSDYQKEFLSVTYQEPNGDDLVPEDTFFFLGVNNSQGLDRYMDENNPLVDQDVLESFDLLEDELGISVRELFELLSGEFAIAVGPANEGLPVEIGEVNLGFTIIASTNNEDGFNDWFKGLLDVAAQNMYVEYQTENVTFGDYTLQEVSVQDFDENITALYYGADNGFFFIGTSQGVFEDGLVKKNTLATNAKYQETWQAFPSSSVPYLYFDMLGLVDFFKDNAVYTDSELADMEKSLSKIPTIGLTVNETKNAVQSQTLIIFLDKGE